MFSLEWLSPDALCFFINVRFIVVYQQNLARGTSLKDPLG